MAVERAICPRVPAKPFLIFSPPDDTVFFPPLPPDYLKYLSELKEEWTRQESLARFTNPAYTARLERKRISREETTQRLSVTPPTEGKKEDIPIEIRNFRFWQKSLLLNEEFREATKEHGFSKDFDVEFSTRQRTFRVKYQKSDDSELLAIETGRSATGEELEEIKVLYGEAAELKRNNGNPQPEIEGIPRKKHIDGTIESVIQKHTIQLAISDQKDFNSTYLAIDRFIKRKKSSVPVPDVFFNPEADFVINEQGKRFVGWLAILLSQ